MAPVVVFNEHTAGVVERFLKKGAKVYVEGSLHTRKWTDQQGIDRYSTEVEIGAYKGEVVLLGDYDRGDDRSDAGGPPNTRRRKSGLQGNQTVMGRNWLRFG